MNEALWFLFGIVIGWVFAPHEHIEDRGAFLRGQIYEAKDPERIKELKEVLRNVENE